MDPGIISPSVMQIDTTANTESPVAVGYQVNLSDDAAGFAQSLERAGGVAGPAAPSAVTEAMFAPLDFINNEARELAVYAENAIESGNELTPSEIVTLTTRSQEFMFYAQLTSNVANRTADGLQQLFRQQS